MASTKSQRIYGTGLLTLDLIVGPDEQMPGRWFAGGTCGNVLAILSFLGWQSYPIARLNGDVASRIVRHDLQSWGVSLDYASLFPQVSTPIIVQRIKRTACGAVVHRFSCNCPYCGSWLPSFKPVRHDTALDIVASWEPPTVFFFDRVSRGMLTLAKAAADSGALVFFEPSAKGDPRHMQEALEIAHIVKYSDQRFPQALSAIDLRTNARIEIQTQGSRGFLYRANLSRGRKGWRKAKSLVTTNVADSAGAGDWFTAAVISHFKNGLDDLSSLRDSDLADILNYANSMAAWNCFFEGARGGMYTASKRQFHAHIRKLQGGETEVRTNRRPPSHILGEVGISPACPACA